MGSDVPMPRRVWWMVLAMWRLPLELFRGFILPKFPTGSRRRYWERCRERAPSTPEYLLLGPGRASSCEELAEIETSEGNFERALTYYAEAVELRSTNPDCPLAVSDAWLLMNYAGLLQKTGRVVEARRLWKQVAEFPPGSRAYEVSCQQKARENLSG